ncbi:6-phosphofructokinase [Trifolium repens]|nr:6-phosphofructokinase [Trifolium repens]
MMTCNVKYFMCPTFSSSTARKGHRCLLSCSQRRRRRTGEIDNLEILFCIHDGLKVTNLPHRNNSCRKNSGESETIDNDIPVIDRSIGFKKRNKELLILPILKQRVLRMSHPFTLRDQVESFIEKRLREPGHVVIVIAEGAGQELIPLMTQIASFSLSFGVPGNGNE